MLRMNRCVFRVWGLRFRVWGLGMNRCVFVPDGTVDEDCQHFVHVSCL